MRLLPSRKRKGAGRVRAWLYRLRKRDDSPPQGLKPSLILHDLRGAKAPLYHSAAGFRDFFRSLFSRAGLGVKLTSPLRLRSEPALSLSKGQAFRR